MSAKFFCFAWGWAQLFHQRFRAPTVGGQTDGLETWIAIVACVLILRPGSWHALAALASAQVLAFAFQSPVASNHYTLAAFCNLAIVVSILLSLKSGDVLNNAYRRFRPAALWLTCIVYFWGVFHKLNADFFDLEVSCAVDLARRMEGRLAIAPNSASSVLAIASTFVFEGGALVLLLTRLWPIAVLGVLPFHLLIGFTGRAYFMDFSTVIFALLITRVDERSTAPLVALLQLVKARLARWRLSMASASATALVVSYAWIQISPLQGRFVNHMLLFGCYSLAVCGALAACVLHHARTRATRSGMRLSPALACVVVPFFGTGLGPYVGFRTEGALAMYSNLRTEGKSNHLLVPASWQIFDYQRPVRILRTNMKHLLYRAELGKGWVTWYQLWLEVKRQPNGKVVYETNGKPAEYNGEHGDFPEYRPGFLMEKLARFKPLTMTEPHPCTH
jgi:hypothetical protein